MLVLVENNGLSGLRLIINQTDSNDKLHLVV